MFMLVELEELSYEIMVERGAASRLADLFPLESYTKIAVISTISLFKQYGPGVGHPILIPDGEQAKSLKTAEFCWREMFQLGLDRRSLIIALGGGSVGDLAGFTAATYMRGIDYIQLPTTLLAMVDASIGGKTGINFSGIKNSVGVIHQPRLVVADPTLLDTLPDEQFWSGMAEVIKAGVLGDRALFEMVEESIERLPFDHGRLDEIIRSAAEVKARVVGNDPTDQGSRAWLNYGHTFGHALESASEFRMVHGQAVSIGMSAAAHLAALLGAVDDQFIDRQDALCGAAHLPTKLPDIDSEALVALMHQDKKAQGGRLSFVIPKELGKVESVCDIEPDLVIQALERKRAYDG